MGAIACPGACAVLEFILLIIPFDTKIGTRVRLENFSVGKNVCGKEGRKKNPLI